MHKMIQSVCGYEHAVWVVGVELAVMQGPTDHTV